MKRFCIIIGAMKAGTTSLFNYLAQHPEIAPCKTKEPGFFSRNYEKGTDWYLSLWAKEDLERKLLLEASTNYTQYPAYSKTTDNIRDFYKNNDVSIKFIFIMRNPIERIVSHYIYANALWKKCDINTHMINNSRYAQQLDCYFEKFDKKNILLLQMDEMKHEPAIMLNKICTFLEIEPDFNFSEINTKYNKSKGQIITRPVNRLYIKYPRFKLFANLSPKSFRLFILKLLFKNKVEGNFKLTEKQRQELYNALKDDIDRLHQKYDVDIKKWGF